MAIPFPQYLKIKDRVCIKYLGLNKEHLRRLKTLLPEIEKMLPGLQVYLVCRDYMYEEEFKTDDRIISLSQYNFDRKTFAHTVDVCDSLQKDDPIAEFLKEIQQ